MNTFGSLMKRSEELPSFPFHCYSKANTNWEGAYRWNDDGLLVAMRYERWKLVFMEQRAHQFGVWMKPFVKLRVPLVFDLQMAPFERASVDANTYGQWMEAMVRFIGVPAQVSTATYVAPVRHSIAGRRARSGHRPARP